MLSSLPLYFFSFYKAPKKVLDEIARLQRQFLWAGGTDRRDVSWVKWDNVCRPKCFFGLGGVKNLELFNMSLLAKWRWRFLNDPDAIWAELLRVRYGDISSITIFPKDI